jgi:hypothetical protein
MKLIKKYPDVLWSAFLREEKPIIVDITSVAECAGSDIRKLFSSGSAPAAYKLPWPHVWFEFSLPDGIRERIGIALRIVSKDRCRANITEIERSRVDQVIDAAYCMSFHGEKPTWVGWSQCFRDKDGKSIRTDFGVADEINLNEPKSLERKKASILVLWKYVDVALTFLSCKNVVAETQRFPESKKRKHTIHDTDVVYKKLVVLLPGQRQSGNGNKADPQNNVRLHVCRGHFADHRERGLFGKEHLRGIYWVPMHVKGSKEVGEVVKHYELRPKTYTPAPP